MCEDGINWTTGQAITSTAATPASTYNVWSLAFRYTDATPKTSAIGDSGFIAGTLSADDLLSLHDFLDDKWGLDS